MHSFLQDARYGLRTLAKARAFTAVAVLSIAIGIAACAVVFTWFKAAFLNPVPGARDPQQLVTMTVRTANCGGCSNSYPEYLYVRDHSHTLDGVIAYDLIQLNISTSSEPQQIFGGIVSANFFDVLGAKPVLGRGFLPEDDEGEGGHPVAVLGYTLWRQRFAADRSIIGKQISINRHPFTIVGVAPPAFSGTYGGLAQELWVPMAMVASVKPEPNALHGPSWMMIMGRLRRGASLAAAQAEMRVLGRQFADQSGRQGKRFSIEVASAAKSERGLISTVASFVPLFAVAAGVLLLIVCANLANLLLSRASAREREIAIRAALGAGRGRIVRQLLTESLLLAGLGAVAGIALAALLAGNSAALLPPIGIPIGLDFAVDGRVLLFTIALTIVTAVLFGIAPALRASKTDLESQLRQSASVIAGANRFSPRNLLVIAQVALCVVALAAAGVVVRSLRNAAAAQPGFNPDHVLLGSMDLYLGGYEDARGRQFFRQIVDRAAALPGVADVSLSTYVPMGLSGGNNSRKVVIAGYTPRADEDIAITTDYVGPNYLRTMQIPLLEGRDFSARDNETSQQVVIVNAPMAARYWPGQSAIGRSVKVGPTWRTVVGVFRDIVYRNVLNNTSDPAMYVPIAQDYQSNATLILRTNGDPAALAPALASAVHSVDPALPLADVMTLRTHIAASYFIIKTPATVLSGFGLVALVLAAIGLYGLIAYSTMRRTREIGVRLALGAAPAQVRRMVIVQGARLAAFGVAVGFVAAVLLLRLLTSLLFGVRPFDPVTLLGTLFVVAAASLLASYVPARRATRVDPLIALRSE